MAFCKEYNAATQDKVGTIIPVEITVYEVPPCCRLSLSRHRLLQCGLVARRCHMPISFLLCAAPMRPPCICKSGFPGGALLTPPRPIYAGPELHIHPEDAAGLRAAAEGCGC